MLTGYFYCGGYGIHLGRGFHADINTTHIYVEIDMEMKRKMIATAGAPKVGNKTPWQQPHVLQWLNQLCKESQLCGLNY